MKGLYVNNVLCIFIKCLAFIMSGFDICPGEEFLLEKPFVEHKPKILPSLIWNEWIPVHKQCVNYNNRLMSFKNWPIQIAQSAEKLSLSGFFYIGNNDSCCCFFCGIVLKRWEKDDNVFTEHKSKAPHCTYIKMIHCM